MFVDEVKVFARAGHGGRGCVAFRREAFAPKGGPDGGDGGRGGNVVLEASKDINNLLAQYYAPRLIARDGEHGLGKGMHGKSGRDLVVKVPCGTLVWKRVGTPPETEPSESGPTGQENRSSPPSRPRGKMRFQERARALEVDLEAEEEGPAAGPNPEQEPELIADLTEDGQQLVLCHGGRGGLGNKNFATSRRQTPDFAQPGEPGEEGEYKLELRLIAEVGLVGYPNAGKSTLLSVISRAHPKIAPYPFSTLHPKVGIVEYEDFHRLRVCDVPGIMEGAHRNVGLGDAFLRHIRRCQILALVLDMAGVDGRDPLEDYRQLRHELELYNGSLEKKPHFVVANKMDEPSAEANLKRFQETHPDLLVVRMAAAFDEGIDTFKQVIRQQVGAVTLH